MFGGKPIIGIVGGIGSGKSFVAGLFAELGCVVIDADAQVREAYRDPRVLEAIRGWWGGEVFTPAGELDRAKVAQLVFANPPERRRLEALVHPWVAAARQREMEKRADDPQVLAFVWDTPLLLEAGLAGQCDAILFVDAPLEVRLRRVAQTRSWDLAELTRRENLQWGLDRKRQISDYVLGNTTELGEVRQQVRDVLSRILARASTKPDRS